MLNFNNVHSHNHVYIREPHKNVRLQKAAWQLRLRYPPKLKKGREVWDFKVGRKAILRKVTRGNEWQTESAFLGRKVSQVKKWSLIIALFLVRAPFLM